MKWFKKIVKIWYEYYYPEESTELEDHWNNKYPKTDIIYNGRPVPNTTKNIGVDVRNFIDPYDSEVKKIVENELFEENMIDDDSTALECLKWVRSHIKYVSDKTKGRKEYWQTAYETLYYRSGDCLMGDTPIIINKGGVSDIVEINDIFPEDGVGDIAYPLDNIRIYQGFRRDSVNKGSRYTNINWIKKKKTDKDIYRINSGKSVIDVTSDHLVLLPHKPTLNSRRWIESGKIKSKKISTIKALNKIFPDYHDKLSYEIGYVYGLFAAEGYCTYKSSNWRIYNCDRSILEKAKRYLEEYLRLRERIFGFRSPKFKIVLHDCFKKGKKTNYGVRNMDLWSLEVDIKSKGKKGLFCKRWYDNFYTKLHNKKVPRSILCGCKEAKKGFIDGHYDGDKGHTTSKILAFGIQILYENLGINARIHNKKCLWVGEIDQKSRIKKRTSKHLGKTSDYVYDINVDCPNLFAAGDIYVHNCEDFSLLLYNLMLQAGVKYWKIRLVAGLVQDNSGKTVGHCFLTYFCEEQNKWVILDGTYHYNDLPISERLPYKEESFYKETWFSWNSRFSFSKDVRDVTNMTGFNDQIIKSKRRKK